MNFLYQITFIETLAINNSLLCFRGFTDFADKLEIDSFFRSVSLNGFISFHGDGVLQYHFEIKRIFSTACFLLLGGLTVEKEKELCPEAILPLENLILNMQN